MSKPVDIQKAAKAPTKGRVRNLHALPYQGSMAYVLQVDEDLFMAFAIVNNQMYFQFVEGELPKGKKKFKKEEVEAYTGIALATAHATIETITGQFNKGDQAVGKAVIDAGEAAWYGKDKKKKKLAN